MGQPAELMDAERKKLEDLMELVKPLGFEPAPLSEAVPPSSHPPKAARR